MKDNFLRLYRATNTCYGNLLLKLHEVSDEITPDDSLNEAADKVYALRQCERIIERAYKEIKKLHALAQKTACLIEMEGNQDSASTEWCSGKSQVNQILVCPQKRRYDPETFDALMKYFGVPDEISHQEFVRPNWPVVQERLNEDLAAGKPIPVQTTDANDYKFVVRARKSLDSTL